LSQSLNSDPLNQDKNKNFNSNNTNSNSLIKSTATKGGFKNISSVFTKVSVPFLELTQIKFLNILFLNLQVRSINSILFQYTSYQQGIYYMLGKQVGVVVRDSHDLNHYRNLFEHYKEMLELLMDRYQLEEPDFITFHFKTLHVEEDLQSLQNNLSKIKLHKGLVKVEKLKQNFNSKVLPYTKKERYFGYLLMENLREQYLSELVTLLAKNTFSVGPRSQYSPSFPIENVNTDKE
jgi:hypothetical protein